MNQPFGPDTKGRRKLLYAGIAAVTAALIIFAIVSLDSLTVFVKRVGRILAPLLIGGAITCICNPIMMFYEKYPLSRIRKKGLKRGISLTLSILTVLSAFSLVLLMIIPQLVSSISNLINHYEVYLDALLVFVQQIADVLNDRFHMDIDISDTQKLMTFLEEMFGSLDELANKILLQLQKWVVEGDVLSNLWGGILSIIDTFKNIFLGLFVAIYLLASKEKRLAQIGKFRRAFFSDNANSRLSDVTTLIRRTFGGFMKGVFIDAVAVGIFMFVLLSLFRVSEYNLLISVICAVTNVIPVFGPFIGAVPSALIVLISNPSKVILLLIIVIVVQQIDGNILCPRIQGNTTGISSLSVLIAITIAGSLWGMVGMIIGVPIFAVAIQLGKLEIHRRLEAKGCPTDIEYYYTDPPDRKGDGKPPKQSLYRRIREKWTARRPQDGNRKGTDRKKRTSPEEPGDNGTPPEKS